MYFLFLLSLFYFTYDSSTSGRRVRFPRGSGLGMAFPSSFSPR